MKQLSTAAHYTFISFLLSTGLLAKEPIQRIRIKQSAETSKLNAQQPPRITIWVHGTSMSVGKLFNKCPEGLNPVSCLPASSHIRKISEVLVKKDPSRFKFDLFYSFGWSGKLSFNEREKQAKILYTSIKDLAQKVKTQTKVEPIICIITHSHGGNLALNLSKAKDESDKDFMIHELIMLACPVQRVTAPMMKDPMFKRIYHFYSQIDMLQIVDPQGGYKQVRDIKKQNKEKVPFFSERRFKPQDNLAQGYVRYKRRALAHIDFILPHVIRNIPTMVAELDRTYTEKKDKHDCLYCLKISN